MSSTPTNNNAHRPQPRTLLIIGLAALALVLAAAIYLGVRAASNPKVEVSVPEAAALRDQGALFLDVRTPDEWKAAHVAGSTLIPLTELDKRMSELPRDRQIVVVCSSGIRSRAGRDMLVSAGFTKVTSMAGGLLEWKGQGYPMITGP